MYKSKCIPCDFRRAETVLFNLIGKTQMRIDCITNGRNVWKNCPRLERTKISILWKCLVRANIFNSVTIKNDKSNTTIPLLDVFPVFLKNFNENQKNKTGWILNFFRKYAILGSRNRMSSGRNASYGQYKITHHGFFFF